MGMHSNRVNSTPIVPFIRRFLSPYLRGDSGGSKPRTQTVGVNYLEIPLPLLAGGLRGVKAEDPDGGSRLFGDSSPPACGGIQGG